MTVSGFVTDHEASCATPKHSASSGVIRGSILGSTGFSLCSLRFHRGCTLGLRNLGPTIPCPSLQLEVSTQDYLLSNLHRSRICGAKPFRIRSYEKCVRNSFRTRSYKNTGLKVPHFHTLTKNMGGYPFPTGTPGHRRFCVRGLASTGTDSPFHVASRVVALSPPRVVG